MSKHKRLKAAKRKQHNKSAKVRSAEWKEYCRTRDLELAAIREQRERERAEAPPPAPPKNHIDRALDMFLDDGALLPGLYHSDGTLDLLNLVKRAESLGGLVFIDTEDSIKQETEHGSTPA